jgi:hypothetical protein
MAFQVAVSSTDKITVTNPLTFGAGTALTHVMWVYRHAANVSANRGMNKGITDVLVRFNSANLWEFNITRAGGIALADVADTALLLLDTWECIALTYDETDGPRIFRGTLTTPMTEVTYLTRTVSSGDTSADSGDLWIGNRSAAGSLSAPLRFSHYAMYSRRFELGELQAHRFDWRPRPDCLFLYDIHGTGTQLDRSGNGRNGTVTGGSIANHVPIRSAASRRVLPYAPYVAAAAAGRVPGRFALLGVS